MVGVPRSKGCSTCKRRKKRCDGVRPVCGLCDHGAFRCEWDSKMIMVHTDNHGKGRYKPAAKRVDLGPQAPPMAELSESLNQSALEMHCIDIFWNMYLPKPVTLSFWRPSSIHHEAKWAEYTSHSASQSMTLKCSLSALSAAKVGRDRQDRCLTQKGIELYGKALALLAKELKTPGDVKPFGVLNCCRILALYEQINDVGASAQNWKGHISGLLNLVRLHPPEDFSHPGTHELFLEARYNGVVSSLSTRTSTFLSDLKWMTKPWENRAKDAIDKAMDVLVKIPGVLEEWDVISTQSQISGVHQRAQILAMQCASMDIELRAFYENFIALLEHTDPACAELLRKGLNDPANQSEIPDVLAGIGLHRLYAMTIYWTSCMIVYAITDLVRLKFSTYLDQQTNSVPFANENILKYCIYIARSARYFLNPDLGLFTTLSLSHAGTCLARTLFEHKSCFPHTNLDDARELRRLMDVVEGLGGFNAWTTWKCGMDDLNHNKREVLDRYCRPDV